jgi:hypothetical protein
MGFTWIMLVPSLALFVGMLAMMWLGRRLGRSTQEASGARPGLAAVEGAVFALLGLLIAFTFSGAAGRFEDRRSLITKEANALGTAWRFLDLLPPAEQAGVRQSFRDYLDARLAVYGSLPDVEAAWAEQERSARIQGALWQAVVASRAGAHQGWEVIVLPALTAVFDVETERIQALRRHPPPAVFLLLIALALGCALLAGLAMSPAVRAPRTHMLGFAAVVSLTVYIIIDLEYPRAGLIRVDSSDQVLIDLRADMK